MKKILAIALCLFWLWSLAKAGSPRGWRGVIPLHSTRSDVERAFGPPDSTGFYDFKTESAEFFYSAGPCVNGYKVPKDTVISIRVIPKGEMRFSDLKLNRRRFRQSRDPELPGLFYYNNDDEGTMIHVSGGSVVDITFGWAKRDRRLLCKKP